MRVAGVAGLLAEAGRRFRPFGSGDLKTGRGTEGGGIITSGRGSGEIEFWLEFSLVTRDDDP